LKKIATMEGKRLINGFVRLVIGLFDGLSVVAWRGNLVIRRRQLKKMKQKLIFCSVIFPGPQAEINSLLLAESIRAFGGKLSNSTIYFFMPDYGKRLTRAAQMQLQKLDVQLTSIKIGREKLKFFFMSQLTGLATIEKTSNGETHTLPGWMLTRSFCMSQRIPLAGW
jgi:hypothetical protein